MAFLQIQYIYIYIYMYIYEMSCKNELKEIQIKNSTSHHFDDIINITDLDLDKVLFNEQNTKIFNL